MFSWFKYSAGTVTMGAAWFAVALVGAQAAYATKTLKLPFVDNVVDFLADSPEHAAAIKAAYART